ncbi:MAG: hypothetical protein ACLTG0_07570 [Oscillibacter sp.]
MGRRCAATPTRRLHHLARFLEAGVWSRHAGELLCSARRGRRLASSVRYRHPSRPASTPRCSSAFPKTAAGAGGVLLATHATSNSVIEGIGAAWADVKAGKSGNFPRCLQNVHADSTGGAQGRTTGTRTPTRTTG